MATAVDYGRTRAARRNRTEKAARLATAAVGQGAALCELRASHPDGERARGQVLRAAGVARASEETWGQALGLLLEHLVALPDIATCAGCGSPVLRGVGRRTPVMLLDPLPRSDGTARTQGRPPLVETLTVAEREAAASAGTPLWRVHTETCPQSVSVRQRLPRSRRCPLCNTALAWWVKDPAYITHPGCEPDDSPRPLGRTHRQ